MISKCLMMNDFTLCDLPLHIVLYVLGILKEYEIL
jgi:hypothetical protein